ncbi:MAG TPA: hypothetical protein VM940_09140 [Chthoniobacterales bacterium]|jgi:hypothetical protein|nr:hypothetical protein [Chthoniobacterales bacterium]
MESKYLFCPLCFQKLDALQTVYISRPADRRRLQKGQRRPAPQAINCDRIQSVIDEDERSFGDPKNGIFLAHRDCSSLNPFFSAEGSGTINFGDAVTKGNEGVIPNSGTRVRHYEVGILKSMSADVREMWFPAALLKITTRTRPKPGCVTVLAGATGVGKTILALQSMHSDGFENKLNKNKISVDPVHFSYAPDPVRFAECVNTIEMLLHPNEALDEWQQVATRPDLGELRAVFYRLASRYEQKKPRSQMSEAWSSVGEIVLGARSPSADSSRWRTVVFYDAAGEHFEDENLQVLEELYDITDNMAVVVEAASLVPCRAKRGSDTYRRWDRIVSTAWEHIDRIQQRAPSQQPRWSVVVTKLDQVKEHLDELQWQKIEHFAEAAVKAQSGVPGEWGEPLELLWELVGEGVSPNQRKLLQRLSARVGQPRPEIFFVWTEGLDLIDGVRVLPSGSDGEVPKSYGLGKFIEWALQEPLSIINFVGPEAKSP